MTVVTGATLEHAIGAEGLLALRLRDGEVRLHGVDGDTVRVRDVNGHNLDDMLAINAAAGSLSLSVGRGLEIIVGPRSMRRGRSHTPELQIDVPRHATVVLEAASGDVDADGLTGDQRYRTASGDVALRAVTGRLSVEVVSGDVDITAMGEADLSIRSVSGDVSCRAATLASLQVTSTSGDIKVAGRFAGDGPFGIETVSGDGLLAPAGDVTVEMTTLTGDLTAELEGRHVNERGRRSFTVGRGGPLVTFQSMSGDLHIARPTSVPGPGPVDPPRRLAAADPIAPPAALANGAIAAAYDEARLRILRALERGEIDIAEAGRRLETLDAGDVGSDAMQPASSADKPADV
jgi:hypothetical protein